MKRVYKYFAIAVVTLYFFLGVFVLVSSRFSFMQKELKVIFAIFLFLYGAYRLVRILTKDRTNEEED
ncbi:MAG TPA: hypothetical protein PKJ28_05460 [Bacteroidales bacterium]|nr:hypothetical protein [Bacteroidales bacterium]HPS72980.1 hypothetical protein [Bacteroidales bacterium]